MKEKIALNNNLQLKELWKLYLKMYKSRFINTENDFNYKNIINIKRTMKQFVYQFHNKEVSSFLNLQKP